MLYMHHNHHIGCCCIALQSVLIEQTSLPSWVMQQGVMHLTTLLQCIQSALHNRASVRRKYSDIWQSLLCFQQFTRVWWNLCWISGETGTSRCHKHLKTPSTPRQHCTEGFKGWPSMGRALPWWREMEKIRVCGV